MLLALAVGTPWTKPSRLSKAQDAKESVLLLFVTLLGTLGGMLHTFLGSGREPGRGRETGPGNLIPSGGGGVGR